MKTPQEEAESLLSKAYETWFYAKGLAPDLPTFMANEIPLAELIAVARAAKKLAQNAEGELLIDTYFNAEGAELLRTLQSLMATGKVTL